MAPLVVSTILRKTPNLLQVFQNFEEKGTHSYSFCEASITVIPKSKTLQQKKIIHVYVWLNPFAIHLKLSQHC